MQHKVRKLVVVGASDSGKSSWANILFGIIPRNKIAILTKEQNFGASMITDDTELLYIDEWTEKMMTSDGLKTLLQGGYFAQSIKNKDPRMQEMNAGVFITCNAIPRFEGEQENVERRLAIFHTRALTQKNMDAPQWMRENAMECIVWMLNVINSNLHHLTEEERFYELPHNVKSNARIKSRVSIDEILKIKRFELSSVTIAPSLTIDDEALHHPNYTNMAKALKRKSKLYFSTYKIIPFNNF